MNSNGWETRASRINLGLLAASTGTCRSMPLPHLRTQNAQKCCTSSPTIPSRTKPSQSRYHKYSKQATDVLVWETQRSTLIKSSQRCRPPVGYRVICTQGEELL